MAGLIPRSFIDDLLDRVDIVEVIGQRVSLKKTGASFKACCPFHDEKTPSFNVNADKQFYHCFGCGAGGNAVSFIMDYENLDFPAAIELLAGHLGLEVPREEGDPKNTAARRKKSESIYDILDWAARFFRRQLREHNEARQAIDYLRGRGLSGELARDFGIGFAPSGWDNLLKAAVVDCSNEQERSGKLKLLEEAGLIIERDEGKSGNASSDREKNSSARQYYDRFRSRVMFPIRDNRGRVIAFGGRVLDDSKPKYLNSPETPVFHKQRELYGLYESRKNNRDLHYLLLVEGYMDVVSLFQFGVSRAVATLGTASGIPHLEKVFRFTSRLVVCFDGDEAGSKAARRLLETALPVMRDGREIRFLFLTQGDDPDSFIRRHGQTAFEGAVERAQTLEDFMFSVESVGLDLDTESGKAKYSDRLLPLLVQLPEGVYQHSLLARLASELQLPVDVMRDQMQRRKPRQSQRHTGSAYSAKQAVVATGVDQQAAVDRTSKDPAPPGRFEEKPEKVEEKIGVRHLRMAIATLLHYPALALEIEMPAALSERNWPEAKLIKGIYDLVARRVQETARPPATESLIGHWHDDSQLESLILECIAPNRPVAESTDIARQELHDTFAAWGKINDSLEREKRFAALERGEILTSNMTSEEIAHLRSLGSR